LFFVRNINRLEQASTSSAPHPLFYQGFHSELAASLAVALLQSLVPDGIGVKKTKRERNFV